MSNISAVRAFCDAWASRDTDAIVERMSEDCFYHNVPMAPLTGRSAIAEFIGAFLKDVQAVEFEIVSIAEASDGTVLTERVDHLDYGEKAVRLPVMGSFQLRNGLIARWVDYFDAAPLAEVMAG